MVFLLLLQATVVRAWIRLCKMLLAIRDDGHSSWFFPFLSRDGNLGRIRLDCHQKPINTCLEP